MLKICDTGEEIKIEQSRSEYEALDEIIDTI